MKLGLRSFLGLDAISTLLKLWETQRAMNTLIRCFTVLAVTALLIGCNKGNPELHERLLGELNTRIVNLDREIKSRETVLDEGVGHAVKYAELAKAKGLSDKVEFLKDDPRLESFKAKPYEASPLPNDSLESLNPEQKAEVETAVNINKNLEQRLQSLDHQCAVNLWYKKENETLEASK